MKYKLFDQKKKNDSEGGDYWREANFQDHLNLTDFQTTFHFLINNYLPPKEVLEAGCGIGRWVIPLSEKGYSVTGIEIEADAINTIKQNYNSSNLKLVVGDIFKMPFDDKSFDIVISLGVLEHFENKSTQYAAIKEHIRVMKDDGLFLVTVPHISTLRLIFHWPFLKLVSFVRFLKGKNEYFTEYRYSKNEFTRVLKENNLKIVEFVYDDLLTPYSFGLTVDYPLNILFKNKDKTEYKLNKFGRYMLKLFWSINPKIVSGGIGFICKKELVPAK